MNVRLVSYVMMVLAAVQCTLQGQNTMPLKTAIPRALAANTPEPIHLSNLEGTDPSRKLELMVPVGTTNVALKKPVTSSDSDPLLGTLDQITDGVKDGDEGNYVELAPGKQWVQIDLGSENNIYAVWVWHFYLQARAYLGVVVQVSDDVSFKAGVTTVFNNDIENTDGLGSGKDPAYIETNRGRLMPVRGAVTGRYVRLYSNGNTSDTGNHYIEVEVYGKGAGK